MNDKIKIRNIVFFIYIIDLCQCEFYELFTVRIFLFFYVLPVGRKHVFSVCFFL